MHILPNISALAFGKMLLDCFDFDLIDCIQINATYHFSVCLFEDDTQCFNVLNEQRMSMNSTISSQCIFFKLLGRRMSHKEVI